MAALYSCQSEEVMPDAEKATGRIVVSVSDAQPFIEVGTRAEQTLTDFSGYVFLLNGTDVDGNTVADKEITLEDDNSCIIPAGSYTITADNRAAAVSGNGAAYYNGTSQTFDLSVGGSVAVSIDLGSPQNAEVKLCVDHTFSDLYDLTEVTFNDGTERTVSLDADGTAYLMIPSDGKAKFNIKATAKSDSHVSDIPSAGVDGTMTVEVGKTYTLNLTAKAITDWLIEIGEGEHTGEFNAPRRNQESLESLEPLDFLGNLDPLESLETLEPLDCLEPLKTPIRP